MKSPNRTPFYLILFLTAIAVLALHGCNSHPSIIGGRGHHGVKPVAQPIVETCPVCHAHFYKGKGKGHHYGIEKHVCKTLNNNG